MRAAIPAKRQGVLGSCPETRPEPLMTTALLIAATLASIAATGGLTWLFWRADDSEEG
jgi:hypothetical protein